jgi:transcriptional regulator with XRE-family HTH domain
MEGSGLIRGGVSFQDMTKARYVLADAAAFGRILQRLRMAEGWTITEFARRAGYNKNHLRLLEQGKNMPSLSILFDLAELFRIEAADLVREIEQARRARKAQRAASMLAAAGLSDTPAAE